MKVYIHPRPENAPDSNGIGRIVHAQYKLLPEYGISLAKSPQRADVIACHVAQAEMPRIDVMHSHGLYFEDLPHTPYAPWNMEANKRIAESARRTKIITVPSKWVARPFQRDMHLAPVVIPHGIYLEQWKRGENKGYVLWNKGRADDVCDPIPAWELANAGIPVLSTFAPGGKGTPEKLHVVGPQNFQNMQKLVHSADIYLATTPETFGIGTIEAMACGIPILGYDWAGTADIVTHQENGYLVKPGDIEGLKAGYEWLKVNYSAISEAARERAGQYTWDKIMPMYASVYSQAAETKPERGVSVVIPSYNYGRYLPECLDSVIANKPDEIIVIDDGSTDNTPEVVKPYLSKVRYIRQENGGVASARNHGIHLASYPFITCLDADDRMASTFIRVLSQALESDPGMGIAYPGISMLQPDGKATPYHAWPPEFSWKVQSQGGVPPGNVIPSGCMFRKSMWERSGGYYQEFAPGEDQEFWTRCLSLGFTAKKVTSEGLFEYRVHDKSASRTKKYHETDTWLPWVKSHEYPFAAPQGDDVRVWSRLQPQVAVIIPVGPGHEQTLLQAVRSVEGQTRRDWELIIVADTDLPADVTKVMPFADIVQGRRLGAGAARNDGVRHVKAPFLVFLDADDYLDPRALEKMLAFYNQKGYVYTDWFAVKENGGADMHLRPFDGNSLKLQHAVTTLMPTVWARQLKFDESLPAWEDVDYYLQARGKGFCGVHLAEPLLYYNVDSGKRRKEAERREKELNALLVARHKGVVNMACGSCPSPAAAPIMAAKRMFNQQVNQQDVNEMIIPTDNGLVELEFIGQQTGARTFQGTGGRTYKAGNNSMNRYIMADAQDVQKLMSTSFFRVVPRKAVVVPQAPPKAPEPITVKPKQVAAAKAEPKPAEAPAPVTIPTDAPAMPATINKLRLAVKKAPYETLVAWEQAERVDGKRKPYLEVLREALKNA